MLQTGLASLRRAARLPRRVFYGWWLAWAGCISGIIQTSLFGLGFGAFFLPIAQEFNTTRAALSGAFSVVRIEGGIMGLLAGLILDRIGPRLMMMVGFFVFGAGLILISLVNSVSQFYAAFMFTAAGASLSWFVPATTVVVNWFARFRSRALSIVLLGSMMGGPLIPILAWSINTFGWRATLVGSGIFVWLVGLPLASIMRHRPEDYGLHPDGIAPDAVEARGAASESAADTPPLPTSQEMTLWQVLRTSVFWLVAAAHTISLIAWGALSVHMIPAMVDIGLSEQTAATMVGATMGVAIVSRLFISFFGDRWGTKRILILAFVFQSVAMVALSLASSLAYVLVFVVFMGIGFGVRGLLLVSLRGELFGRRSFAAITGVLEPIVTVGYVLAPIFAGYVYDVSESYKWAFLILAGVNLVGVLFLIPVPTGRRTEGASRSSA